MLPQGSARSLQVIFLSLVRASGHWQTHCIWTSFSKQAFQSAAPDRNCWWKQASAKFSKPRMLTSNGPVQGTVHEQACLYNHLEIRTGLREMGNLCGISTLKVTPLMRLDIVIPVPISVLYASPRQLLGTQLNVVVPVL